MTRNENNGVKKNQRECLETHQTYPPLPANGAKKMLNPRRPCRTEKPGKNTSGMRRGGVSNLLGNERRKHR